MAVPNLAYRSDSSMLQLSDIETAMHLDGTRQTSECFHAPTVYSAVWSLIPGLHIACKASQGLVKHYSLRTAARGQYGSVHQTGASCVCISACPSALFGGARWFRP